MQSAVKIAVSACLFTSVLATLHHNSPNLRHDGVFNLYPFPKMGRGSPQQTWELLFNDLNIDNSTQFRRGGGPNLFPFPRVGRSVPQQTWELPFNDLYIESPIHHELKNAISDREKRQAI